MHWRILALRKSLNLKSVKKVVFTFDPFGSKVRSIREMVFLLNYPNVLESNSSVQMKFDVVCNRADPQMEIHYVDATQTVYKTKNLSTLELMDHFHGTCTDKNPQKDDEMAR